MKKRVLIRGPILTQSGYGVHARTLYRALQTREDLFDIFLDPIEWGQTSWLWEDNEERKQIDQLIGKTQQYKMQGGQFDINLIVSIPSEWEKYRAAPINIGVTAGIETSKVAPQWLDTTNRFVDKLITISNFSKKVFEQSEYQAQDQFGNKVNLRLEKPIDVVNYPVRKHKKKKLNLKLEHDFNFLCVAQWGPRKNVPNTVKWFVEEFIDQEVGLVLKTNRASGSLIDKLTVEKQLKQLLQEYPQRKCKVYLLHGYMSESEMNSLYQHPQIKSLISFSHGEGYGLPLFEAAYNGLPVITHDWGGQTDFLMHEVSTKNKKKSRTRMMCAKVDYDLLPIQKDAVWDGVLQADSMWAFPKQGSCKMKMREVYKDYDRFEAEAKKLKKILVKDFTEEKIYEDMIKAIMGEQELKKEDNLSSVNVEDLPKISIITSVFNGDDFIEPFLEDITNQTIFEKKCELILINANSPGNEEEIILKYQKKYPDNIVYKKLDKDPGIYGVWNLGLELSTGKFITNANLDDRKAPNSLEVHAKTLYLNDDVDLVYSDMLITDKPNETWENNSSNNKKYNFPEFSFNNLKMINMPHSSPMWRKNIHDKYGKFDDKYRSGGDWEMWLRASSQGSKFKKIKEVSGLYYFNPKGISTNPDNFEWKRKEEVEIYEKYKNLSVVT